MICELMWIFCDTAARCGESEVVLPTWIVDRYEKAAMAHGYYIKGKGWTNLCRGVLVLRAEEQR